MLASTALSVQGTGAPVPAEMELPPASISLAFSLHSTLSSLDPTISLSRDIRIFDLSPAASRTIQRERCGPGYSFTTFRFSNRRKSVTNRATIYFNISYVSLFTCEYCILYIKTLNFFCQQVTEVMA